MMEKQTFPLFSLFLWFFLFFSGNIFSTCVLAIHFLTSFFSFLIVTSLFSNMKMKMKRMVTTMMLLTGMVMGLGMLEHTNGAMLQSVNRAECYTFDCDLRGLPMWRTGRGRDKGRGGA